MRGGRPRLRIDGMTATQIPPAVRGYGEITQAGLPVAPGFAIGAPAYAAVCDVSGLRARVAAPLEAVR
jgi:hypothetical protein